MDPGILGALASAAILIGLALVIVMLNDRFEARRRRNRLSPDERQQEAEARRARLLTPKWDEVERRTGGRPSAALASLYADAEMPTGPGLVVPLPALSGGEPADEYINEFVPADGQAFDDPWYAHLPATAFAFAVDDFGDFLFVELTPDGPDGPVQHWYHDGGDIEIVEASLSSFLLRLRESKRRDTGS